MISPLFLYHKLFHKKNLIQSFTLLWSRSRKIKQIYPPPPPPPNPSTSLPNLVSKHYLEYRSLSFHFFPKLHIQAGCLEKHLKARVKGIQNVIKILLTEKEEIRRLLTKYHPSRYTMQTQEGYGPVNECK